MKKLNLLFVVCGLLAAAACTQENFRGTDIGGVAWGGDFVLTAHTGRAVNTDSYRGKALVLFFGYTHCPDICAPTLIKLAQAQKQLGADAERVQVLFVTVDPRHDTAAALAKFVPAFHPSFIGLTGSEADIAAVAREHKVPFTPGAATVEHSGTMVVKDAHGKPRLLWRNETGVDDLVHDLRLLLKQG
jgi:protein SCO1/2